ncbi:MAG TPA: efflux RND transporter periplasmic adaptor subunit [Daejeonella sp.]|nr:efflux RND transporter periplasmic adaptor subunit [Daejeonella sp.]
MKTKTILISFAITITGYVSSCSNETKQKTNQPPTYPVLLLTPHPATIYYDYPATIQGEEVVEIRPIVDGYLETIYVQEGATVKKGQLLFRIKNPQYEQNEITAKAAIKSAIADVNTAEMNVEKVRPLVEKEIISKYELEAAQYALQSKESALAQAKAALVNAQTNVGYTIIRSPQNGVIGSIPYKIGALVNSTTPNPLTILSNIRNVYAYFSLNEKQLLAFSNRVAGSTLQDKLNHLPPVSLLLADGSEYPQKGKIETASGLISTTTGTASFKAIFHNPVGIIRSGASATVRIPRTIDTALLVPQSASIELQDKRLVYVLKDGNKVFSRAIVSTPSNDGQFLIVQKGLKKDDKVVLSPINLKDSIVITPRLINADSLYRKSPMQ